MLHRREMLPAIVAIGASAGLGACREDAVYQSTGGQFPGTGTMVQREALIRRPAGRSSRCGTACCAPPMPGTPTR